MGKIYKIWFVSSWRQLQNTARLYLLKTDKANMRQNTAATQNNKIQDDRINCVNIFITYFASKLFSGINCVKRRAADVSEDWTCIATC